MGEDSLHRKPSGENVFYIENLPGGLFSVEDAFLYDSNDVDCFGGRPFPAGFPCRFSRMHDISFILCNNDLVI